MTYAVPKKITTLKFLTCRSPNQIFKWMAQHWPRYRLYFFMQVKKHNEIHSNMAVLSTHQCYCQQAVTLDQWGYRHAYRRLSFQLTSVTVSKWWLLTSGGTDTFKDGCTFNSPVLLSVSGDSWPVGVHVHRWLCFQLTSVTVSEQWLVTSGVTDMLTDGCAFNSPVSLSSNSDSWPVGIQTRSQTAVLSTHQCYCQLAVTHDQWGYRHAFNSPVLLSASGDSWPVGVQTRFQLTSVTVS